MASSYRYAVQSLCRGSVIDSASRRSSYLDNPLFELAPHFETHKLEQGDTTCMYINFFNCPDRSSGSCQNKRLESSRYILLDGYQSSYHR